MNIVVLTGNLTKDPEMRYTPEGKAVTEFRIAVNEGSGERRTTEYFDCVAWERLAETVAEYTRKGRKVLVNGSLKTETWTNKQGQKQTTPKIRCRNVEFLDAKQVSDTPEARPADDDLTGLSF